MDENTYIKLLDEAIGKIPSGTKDTDRWSIPVAEVIYEGKNTIITNFKKICEELGRDEKHFFKFICKELGAAGDIQMSSGRAVLKSVLKKPSINKQITQYVKNFVLCTTCNKPDTVIIKESRNHMLICQACGTRRIVKL